MKKTALDQYEGIVIETLKNTSAKLRKSLKTTESRKVIRWANFL